LNLHSQQVKSAYYCGRNIPENRFETAYEVIPFLIGLSLKLHCGHRVQIMYNVASIRQTPEENIINSILLGMSDLLQ
jgi:hypothetical protein